VAFFCTPAMFLIVVYEAFMPSATDAALLAGGGGFVL